MTLGIPQPLNENQLAIRAIRQEFLSKGFTPHVSSKMGNGYAEATARLVGEINTSECISRVEVSTTQIDALHHAEIGAMVMCADEIGLKIDFQPKTSFHVTKEIVTWDAGKVMSYKSKGGIPMLFLDMKRAGYDISPIEELQKQCGERKQRLTLQKIVDNFFSSRKKVTVINTESEITLRKDVINKDWMAIYSKLKSDGWNEEQFSKTDHKKTFSDLIDFCKFATSPCL